MTRQDLNVIKMPRELNNVERVLELFGQEVSLGHFVKAIFGEHSRISKFIHTMTQQNQLTRNGNNMMAYNPELESLR